MKNQRLLIDWPLTPYTGWGSYGIQLAQALIAGEDAKPVLTYRADRSPHCDPHWLIKLDELEAYSHELIKYFDKNPRETVNTNCQVAMGPMGNEIPPLRCLAKHQIGVTFFERTTINAQYIETLERYRMIITGSHWNHQLLIDSGYKRSEMIHQGVDTSRFNSIPTHRLLKNEFIIFAGGKLEARKGQDIVIAAFREFIKKCPDALLIACWGNIGNVGLETISQTPHISGAPKQGNNTEIMEWLSSNGIPGKNILLAPIMANSMLANLMKQADVAVFTSRCEGGTNLMAMETLACGIPTILSANTGHLDLLEMKLDHAIAIGIDGRGKVPKKITSGYGGDKGKLWGETNPEELAAKWMDIWREKSKWAIKGIEAAKGLESMSWKSSMKNLTTVLKNNEIL